MVERCATLPLSLLPCLSFLYCPILQGSLALVELNCFLAHMHAHAHTPDIHKEFIGVGQDPACCVHEIRSEGRSHLALGRSACKRARVGHSQAEVRRHLSPNTHTHTPHRTRTQDTHTRRGLGWSGLAALWLDAVLLASRTIDVNDSHLIIQPYNHG